MPLIVEDGTGREDANAFISHVYALQYWVERGRGTVPGKTDHPSSFADDDPLLVGQTSYVAAQIDAAIVRATQYLSESFRWKGYRTYGRNSTRDGVDHFQALAWPRYGVYDREGAYVPNSGEGSIPRRLKWATAEAAFYELENPSALQPAYTAHDRVKMEKAGPVAVTYDTSRQDAYGARPVLLLVQDLIGEFLDTAAGGGGGGAGGSRVSSLAVRG